MRHEGPHFRLSDGFAVVRNRLLGLGDGRVMVLERIRPQPAVERGLIRLQHVLAQRETGVQESLIVLAGGVQVLHQCQKTGAVEIGERGFHVDPTWGGFFHDHTSVAKPRLREKFSEHFVFTQITPLPERQLAQADFSDAHALQGCHAQSDEFAHAADLAFASFVEDET